MEFDFLIDGEFLRVPLHEHMEHKNISTVSRQEPKTLAVIEKHISLTMDRIGLWYSKSSLMSWAAPALHLV